MHPTRTAAALLGALALGSAQADTAAFTPAWTLRLGPAHVHFDTRADVSVAGSAVPGANARASSNTTLGFALEYQWDPHWSAHLLAGIPPQTTLSGSGALAAAGTLGKVTYAPAVASVTWRFDPVGGITLYLGAGINYTIVLRSRDAFISPLDVDNAWSPVLHAGFELPLADGWSMSLDARQLWLKTHARGNLPAMGGAPAKADVQLNPLVLFAAVGKRF